MSDIATKALASVKTVSLGLPASSSPALILARTTASASKAFVTASLALKASTARQKLVLTTAPTMVTATLIQNAFVNPAGKAETAA